MPAKPKSKAQGKGKRDVELTYPVDQFAAKLRRLADCLEGGKAFTISLGGERGRVPRDAIYNIEHERGNKEQEIEFQLKWKN